MILLDTSVAVPLRDGEPAALRRLTGLHGTGAISVITFVEMVNGLGRAPDPVDRADRFERFLLSVRRLDLDGDVAAAYRRMVAAIGFSRPRVLDRLIAATALAHDLPLATRNGRDFADVPGLRLEDWT